MICYTNAGGGGSSSSAWAYIAVSYPSGSTCTATNGTKTLTADGTSGAYVFGIEEPSSIPETWTVSCTDGTRTVSQTVSISSQYQCSVIAMTYGRLPVGYQEVEYLQSSGTQYIELDEVLSTTGITVTAKYVINSNAPADSCVLGCYDSSSYNGYTIGFYNGTYVRQYIAQAAAAYSNVSNGSEAIVIMNNADGEVVENDVVIDSVVPTGTIVSNTRFNLFGLYSAYGNQYAAYAKIFYVQITNKTSGDYIYNLVPCYRTSDNVAGMFDMVSETFLPNDGTGTFSVGADV